MPHNALQVLGGAILATRLSLRISCGAPVHLWGNPPVPPPPLAFGHHSLSPSPGMPCNVLFTTPTTPASLPTQPWHDGGGGGRPKQAAEAGGPLDGLPDGVRG